ncbi:MAG: hypothetical protein WDO18_00250 [Acidobacteriota bacterium]
MKLGDYDTHLRLSSGKSNSKFLSAFATGPSPTSPAQPRPERWTRDPFDRMIVAQARLAKAHLITRDTIIQTHYPKAIG